MLSGYTFFPKASNTTFVVRNLVNKRIRIFNYPIEPGQTRDLLTIPEISESDIRHSLLKGEVGHKIKVHEIEVVNSDIDLLQFNYEQLIFLQNAGITDGLQVIGLGDGYDNVNIFTLHVQPAIGNDATGDGSLRLPFETIQGAFNAIPAHGNNYSVWADEKYVIHLGPGRYTAGATLRQKRRSISIQGDGAIVVGAITFIQDRTADWPNGAAFAIGSMPEPWKTNGSPLQAFELQGVGGGMEGGQTSNNIIFLGKITYTWASNPGSFTSYLMIDRIQSRNNIEFTCPIAAAPSATIEINDSAFNSGVIGSDGTSGHVLYFKAHNSQISSRIGPFCNILEIDNCRIGEVRRNLNFAGGAASGTIVYPPVFGTLYSGISNCGFSGVTYAFGAPGGVNSILIDEVSLGKLLTKTLTMTNCTFTLSDIISGTTLARPTAFVPNGFRYFDTILGIPIWRLITSGTGWVNASGIAV